DCRGIDEPQPKCEPEELRYLFLRGHDGETVWQPTTQAQRPGAREAWIATRAEREVVIVNVVHFSDGRVSCSAWLGDVRVTLLLLLILLFLLRRAARRRPEQQPA